MLVACTCAGTCGDTSTTSDLKYCVYKHCFLFKKIHEERHVLSLAGDDNQSQIVQRQNITTHVLLETIYTEMHVLPACSE